MDVNFALKVFEEIVLSAEIAFGEDSSLAIKEREAYQTIKMAMCEANACPQLSEVRELAEKIIIAHEKLSKFAGGNHHRHNGCCNYIGTTQGWCNCGVSDLDKAKEFADKILAHFI